MHAEGIRGEPLPRVELEDCADGVIVEIEGQKLNGKRAP
jgi:hypothetical protein